MSSPWTIIIGILVIGVFFVLVPVVVETFLRFRIKRSVTCPETGQTAEVDLDVARAAAGSAFGRLALRVKSCSFWPARAGCAQHCLDTEKLDAEHTTRE
jgi:hypothetical protein